MNYPKKKIIYDLGRMDVYELSQENRIRHNFVRQKSAI